jgi:hypothetical protein
MTGYNIGYLSHSVLQCPYVRETGLYLEYFACLLLPWSCLVTLMTCGHYCVKNRLPDDRWLVGILRGSGSPSQGARQTRPNRALQSRILQLVGGRGELSATKLVIRRG